jgi:hypothetical protein
MICRYGQTAAKVEGRDSCCVNCFLYYILSMFGCCACESWATCLGLALALFDCSGQPALQQSRTAIWFIARKACYELAALARRTPDMTSLLGLIQPGLPFIGAD